LVWRADGEAQSAEFKKINSGDHPLIVRAEAKNGGSGLIVFDQSVGYLSVQLSPAKGGTGSASGLGVKSLRELVQEKNETATGDSSAKITCN
jgi:hypothetical protein